MNLRSRDNSRNALSDERMRRLWALFKSRLGSWERVSDLHEVPNRHPLLGIIMVAAFAVIVALNRGCDNQAYGHAPSFRTALGFAGDQWDEDRPRDTLRLCASNHEDAEGVKVCDE